MFPRQGSFKYPFQVNKPWSYELITAPFNFPIYKDDKQVEREQREILRTFLPYYKKNEQVEAKQQKALSVSLDSALHIPAQYKNYISGQLKFVYKQGIINKESLFYGDSKTIKYNAIQLVDGGQMAHVIPVDSLFTTRTAYEYIINHRPDWLNEEILKSCNINYFLSDNLMYDKTLSERGKQDMLAKVSISQGMVQAGEKIIDRGEIVTPETAQILNSLKKELEKQKGFTDQGDLMWIGEIILIVALMTLLFLYLFLFRYHIYKQTKSVLCLLLLILLLGILSSLTLRFTPFSIYIIPFALLPILTRIFFDSRTALFVHIITVLYVATSLPDSFGFLLLQLTAGMTVVSNLKDLTQRSQLARTALLIFVNYAIVYTGYTLLLEGSWASIDWHMFLYFAINAFLLLFSYGFIWIFEKLFGFLSNVSLIELSNMNSDFMLKFAEIAPGSFQHSMQVSNLAAEATREINGNALLVRVGALYHDLGKMENPLYFTENQLNGVNPLAEMEYQQAAQLIIKHVDDGVRLAKKQNLPQVIIDFIATHHGKGRTKYFYNSFKNKFPGANIDESAFHYHGPAPQTKEQAVLMMADAVEASSRSLSSYSDEIINHLVDDIINGQIADGLLKQAKITFSDVEVVKAVFKEKLKTIYHTRVQYPELNNDEKN